MDNAYNILDSSWRVALNRDTLLVFERMPVKYGETFVLKTWIRLKRTPAERSEVRTLAHLSYKNLVYNIHNDFPSFYYIRWVIRVPE